MIGDAGQDRGPGAAGRARRAGRALPGDQGASLPRQHPLQPRPAGGGQLARDRADLRGRRLRHCRRGHLQGDLQVLLRLGPVPDRGAGRGQLRQRGVRGRPAGAGAVARHRAVAERALRPEGPRAPVPEGGDRRRGRRLSQRRRPHRHPAGRPARRGPRHPRPDLRRGRLPLPLLRRSARHLPLRCGAGRSGHRDRRGTAGADSARRSPLRGRGRRAAPDAGAARPLGQRRPRPRRVRRDRGITGRR
jgi:hypothetical protein